MKKKDFETETIAEIIRVSTREILLKRPTRRILFLELRHKVGEIVKGRRYDFSDHAENPKKLRPDFFIQSLLTHNSNLAVFSNGAEVWVTYSNHIHYLRNFEELKVVSSSFSKAEQMRKIARGVLGETAKASLLQIRRSILQANTAFRVQALLIRKAEFVVASERQGVFITLHNRVSLL